MHSNTIQINRNPYPRNKMEEEHKIAIQEGFSTLDKILAHDTWDFIKEKQGVSVYSTVLPDHPCSIFKGEGVIARVIRMNFLLSTNILILFFKATKRCIRIDYK